MRLPQRSRVLPTIFLIWAATVPALSQTPGSYPEVVSQLQMVAPRADSVAAVRGLVLRRDAMEFRLDSGRLFLLTPVAGRTVGALFTGHGSVAFTPALPVERASLKHLLGDTALNSQLSSVVLFFADSTLGELGHRLTFAPDSFQKHLADAVNDALDRFIDRRFRRSPTSFMTALLNGDANGFFYAYVKRSEGEDLMFEVDPDEPEPITLLRKGRLSGQRTQTICQLPREADVGDTLGGRPESPLPLHVDAYDIDARIDNGLAFAAVTTVHLTARRDGARWARFLLFDELQVDSILEEDGSRDSFFRAKGSYDLWVRFGAASRAGHALTIRVAYHGRLIDFGSVVDAPYATRMAQPHIRDQWFFIKDTETWYPRYDFWQGAQVDLRFHTPARYQFASIGRLVDSSVADNVRNTHWVAERPTGQVSFNIGEFKEFEITDPRIPPVTVQVNLEAHRHLDAVLVQPRDPEVDVGGDVANSLAFFTSVFGPPLFSRYYATEIPYGHGQAFPGLIHLSWFTFQSIDESGINEIFRAHEMAHQWWGIGVEPASYRDVWLSEGFSDFAGLWYMQRILKDNQKYFRQLRTWRDAIHARRNDAAPIALGTRTIEFDPRDYSTIVNEKGAWVLQMLRNMMVDLKTMNENAFTTTMRDFYLQYRGKAASTRDFQRVVESHIGLPMGWFFDQWVYGTAIPTYVLSWRTDSTAVHPHVLHVRVRQEGVPPNFIMPVPLFIKFADSSDVLIRVNVRGPVTEGEVALPARPVRLELNPLESVLAEVKQEGWR